MEVDSTGVMADSPDPRSRHAPHAPAESPPRASKTIVWIVLVFLVLVAVIDQSLHSLPQLLRQDLYHFDACQHIWWTYRYRDPHLFPNDPIAEYMSQPVFGTYGFKAIFRVLVPLIDPQVLSELMPFVLCIPTMLLAFAIGRRVGNGTYLGGFTAIFVAIYAELLYETRGGFPRSYAVPLLLLGIWAMLSRRQAVLGVALVASALLYPPALVTLAMTTAVVYLVRLLRERKLPQGWVSLAILGTIALAIVGFAYARPLPAWMGPKVTRAEAMKMPEFHDGGRTEFFTPVRNFKEWNMFYFKAQRSGLGIRAEKCIACVILLALTALILRGSIPLTAWALLGCSLFTFLVAHLTLFSLYLPSRQTMFAVPMFGMMWLSAVVPRIIYLPLPGFTQIAEALGRRWVHVALIVASLGLLGYDAGLTTYGQLKTPPHWKPAPPNGMEEAFAFIRTLPKDTIVAGHPFDLDHVPLRTQRSALAWDQIAMPFHLGFYAVAKEQILAEFRALFATDWADVDALHDRFGVSVFLVNTQRFVDRGSIGYRPPFSAEIQKLMAAGSRDRFVLLHPPDDRVLFRSGSVTLVRVGPPRSP